MKPQQTTQTSARTTGVHRWHKDAESTPVTQVMTRDVVIARPQMKVDALVQLMLARDMIRVPVVDEDNTPLGVVSRTDLVRVQAEHGGLAGEALVREVMTPAPLRLRHHNSIAQAAEMMALQRVHGCPVVDDNGALLGWVSALDVLGWLAGLE